MISAIFFSCFIVFNWFYRWRKPCLWMYLWMEAECWYCNIHFLNFFIENWDFKNTCTKASKHVFDISCKSSICGIVYVHVTADLSIIVSQMNFTFDTVYFMLGLESTCTFLYWDNLHCFLFFDRIYNYKHSIFVNIKNDES